MKIPFVFNAKPFKTDIIPITVRGPYDVYVGALDEDKLPTYMIINRNTSVVEFTSEVLPIIDHWLEQAAPVQRLSLGSETNGQQLSLALKN